MACAKSPQNRAGSINNSYSTKSSRMKTKLTMAMAVAVIALSNFQSTNAQNSSPYWSLAGNSNTSSSSKLGTTNSVPLRFFTNNGQRMILTTSGDVGLGTNTPAYRLDVTRSTGVSNMARFNNVYTGTSGDRSSLINIKTGEGFEWRYGVGGLNNSLGLNTGQFYIERPGSGSYLTILSSGNVGIGYNAPFKRLYVASPGSYTEDNSSGGDAIIVRGNGAGACYAVNTVSINSYGIYASTGNTASYAGYFGGNVFTTGTYQPSDRNFKQNILDLTSAMSIINKLQPKEYEYRQNGNLKMMNLPQGKHYGLIAQDVEQVLPNLVKETKFDVGKAASATAATSTGVTKGEVIDFKALNYTELIPIMIKAMQELSKQNQELSDKNEDLQKQIDELKGVKTTGTPITASAQSVTNLTLSSASLDNYPNPFTGATTIRYNLPAGFKAAQINITDNNGKTIKQVQLSTAGTGTVNIDASTLTSGTYNYSLVVDGKVLASKKMTVTR